MLDIVDRAIRRWFVDHALTTAALTGVLVLLITTLVVDRVVRGRQIKDRAQVIAAQSAILARQAARASQTVTAALAGTEERDAASDEVRTYMTMLLISAPVLIDARQARAFLEEAQRLGGELAHVLSVTRDDGELPAALDARVHAANERVRAAGQPLLATLDLDQLAAVGGDRSSPEDPGADDSHDGAD